ncbi:hypothetical protein N7532_002757 [Penicillium argentinense]|uniref:Amidohydrolase-related domain-containing protein n=1 Tax=Penicillium argentinense TaxID=1131581 RepID=A0A9W9G131_9EURO|nr:uncharacterized protein N7532_002757 [Penicillium argentinense]KAJ5110112.1 hypothetical protein N7532_002757 [Penicillium argentinense]
MSGNLSSKPWLPSTSPPTITFYNANLVDTESGEVIPNSVVKIKNGSIIKVTSRRSEELLFDSESNAVDLKGQYICPVQITIAYRTAFVAREMLLRGFTTARDTGGADAALRDAISEGLLVGPRLFIAGKALSQTGGHGDFRASYQGDEYKCCGGYSPSFARVCNGVPECLNAARDELRQGADFIKIMCGGGVATPTDALDMLQFTAQEIQAITTTASNSKTYVTAHAYSVEAIRHAVDNGVRGIEHGNFIDEETAAYCKEKGVVFTPTLVTYKGMTQPPFDQFLDKFSREKNRQVLASGLGALSILQKTGATICYGSDLLAGLHSLQNEEFSIRSSVLSSKEILQSATINAAKLLGMQNRLGCIKEGAIADILILNNNPLQDITLLDRIDKTLFAILKDGRVVFKRSDWLSVDPLYDPCRIQPK